MKPLRPAALPTLYLLKTLLCQKKRKRIESLFLKSFSHAELYANPQVYILKYLVPLSNANL